MNQRAGTSHPPQMVNQTQPITGALEAGRVAYWLVATLLVVTPQTAAGVHFVLQNPHRTSRPEQRLIK